MVVLKTVREKGERMSAKRRCVRLEGSRKAKPWRAKLKIAGKTVDLGRWATRVEGMAAYRAVRNIFPMKPLGRPRKKLAGEPAKPALEYPEQLELFHPDEYARGSVGDSSKSPG
jgi:hypothetical protein